jgi:glutamate-ammonia-ligase adenylyltransferase
MDQAAIRERVIQFGPSGRAFSDNLQQRLETESDPSTLAQNAWRLADSILGASSKKSDAFFGKSSQAAFETIFANSNAASIRLQNWLFDLLGFSKPLASILLDTPESLWALLEPASAVTDRDQIRDALTSSLNGLVDSVLGAQKTAKIFRRFRGYHSLRIASATVLQNLSFSDQCNHNTLLIESICQSAIEKAWQIVTRRLGVPLVIQEQSSYGATTPFPNENLRAARFAILGGGKLGGAESSFQNGIPLMFLAETNGSCNDVRRTPNREFFERLASVLLGYLTTPGAGCDAYDIDLKFRAFGDEGPLVMEPNRAMEHYEFAGRTWQRLAYVKTRFVAGERDFGNAWLRDLEPWVFKRFLTRADITGIRAVKHRADRRAEERLAESLDIKSGHGGIRDIEFSIQFLQLLNGGDSSAAWRGIRANNTLIAIEQLRLQKCLTQEEGSLLEENYRALRDIETSLQLAFGFSEQAIPGVSDSLQIERFNFFYEQISDRNAPDDFNRFLEEVREICAVNRRILRHLMEQVFSSGNALADETDLILDPDPSNERAAEVLAKHNFRNSTAAMNSLQRLAVEEVRFLSSRRCRHFFAGIAPSLLAAVGACPNPDETLRSLDLVAQSIGGKAVLWELFSSHRASMELCIQLCSSSNYLTGILQSHPGMIDELMDSLMLESLPSRDEIASLLEELTRNADDVIPIVHAFKSSMHLRIGIRDILRKQPIEQTLRSLADVADVCLTAVINDEYLKLIQRYGVPRVADPSSRESQSELIVAALGKLGGQEPNYHSDFELMFFFTEKGHTAPLLSHQRIESISNQQFFDTLTQRVVQAVNRTTSAGRLFELHCRLPIGDEAFRWSMSIDDLRSQLRNQSMSRQQQQALCRARTIIDVTSPPNQVDDVLKTAIAAVGWSAERMLSLEELRAQLQSTATDRNLKRGLGGTLDIEFIVQALQMEHGSSNPRLLIANTWEAISEFKSAKILEPETATVLSENYQFLRNVESALRLMNTKARHDLPNDQNVLERLALLLGIDSPQTLIDRCRTVRAQNRALFEQLIGPVSIVTPSD